MKKAIKKIASVMLAMFMVIGVMFSVTPIKADAATLKHDYTLEGSDVDNLVNVAVAQLGRSQSTMGYTDAWCAMFVNDCAKAAGISSSIIPYNYSGRNMCTNLCAYMLSNCNAKIVTTPKKGDLVFYKCSVCSKAGYENCYVHVGIVVDSTRSIEGNLCGNDGSKVRYKPFTENYTDSSGHKTSTNKITRVFIRPNYVPEPPKDNILPTISDVRVTDVTRDGFTVSCHVTDNCGVASVKFPVWREGQTGNDARWYEGSYNASTCNASVRVPASDFSGFSGQYFCHIYAYDTSGNSSCSGTSGAYVDREPPTISNIYTNSESNAGHLVYAVITDNDKVDHVDFHITAGNGMTYDEAGKCGINNKWFLYVRSSDFNNYIGNYTTRITAYDKQGNVSATKSISDTITKTASADLGSFYAVIHNTYNDEVFSTAGKTDASYVRQSVATGGTNQLFHFARQSSGLYKITDCLGNRLLTVENGAASDNTNVVAIGGYAENEKASLWRIVSDGNGRYMIYSACTPRRVLCTKGLSTSGGADAVVYYAQGIARQSVTFEKFDSVEDYLSVPYTANIFENVCVSNITSAGYTITWNYRNNISVSSASIVSRYPDGDWVTDTVRNADNFCYANIRCDGSHRDYMSRIYAYLADGTTACYNISVSVPDYESESLGDCFVATIEDARTGGYLTGGTAHSLSNRITADISENPEARDSSDQLWVFRKATDSPFENLYYISNKGNELSLCVENGTAAEGTKVICEKLTDHKTSSANKWSLSIGKDGNYSLSPACSPRRSLSVGSTGVPKIYYTGEKAGQGFIIHLNDTTNAR